MILGWSPGIGDPTLGGWISVIAYVGAAALCWRAGGRDRNSGALWRTLALGLVLLGINKQLDLQSLLTAIGRELAQEGDWYARRRVYQREFILGIAGAAVLAAIAVLLIVRRRSGAIKGAALGFIMLCAFIVMRAASFHKMDVFLHSDVMSVRWNHVLELGGIIVIGVSAALARPAGRRRRRR